MLRYWEIEDKVRANPAKYQKISDRARGFLAAALALQRPFPKQLEAIDSEADIVMCGGGVGSGKTSTAIAMLMSHQLRFANSECLVLRNTRNEIKQQGGIWSRLVEIADDFDSNYNLTELYVNWPNKSTVKCEYLDDPKSTKRLSGAEVDMIIIDEVQLIPEESVRFVGSRNRNEYGIRNRQLWTCNPAPGTWLAKFISWWWDPETGYPIKERSGVVRYFIREGEGSEAKVVWFDTKDEGNDYVKEKGLALPDDHPDAAIVNENLVKGFTFIPSTMLDNPYTMSSNPGYYAELLGKSEAEREALLFGNWKEIKGEGTVFQKRGLGRYRTWLEHEPDLTIVALDTASKANAKSDKTALIKMALYGGRVYILDSHEAKVEFPQLEALARSWAEECDLLVVEDKMSGISLCQVLDQSVPPVPNHAYKIPAGDLKQRALKVSVFSEQGRIVFPPAGESQSCDDLFTHLLKFDGKHSDLVSAFIVGARFLFDKAAAFSMEVAQEPQQPAIYDHIESEDYVGAYYGSLSTAETLFSV